MLNSYSPEAFVLPSSGPPDYPEISTGIDDSVIDSALEHQANQRIDGGTLRDTAQVECQPSRTALDTQAVDPERCNPRPSVQELRDLACGRRQARYLRTRVEHQELYECAKPGLEEAVAERRQPLRLADQCRQWRSHERRLS